MLNVLISENVDAEEAIQSVDVSAEKSALDPVTGKPLPPGVEILPPPYAPRQDISGLNVLVIDGNRFHRDLIKSALGSQRIYAFHEAPTISAAKNRMSSIDRIDLIVLENNLEGEDGLSFVKRIRRGETVFEPAIPVVMVTEVRDHDIVMQARNAGVHEFVCKPFDTGTLVEHVRRPFVQPRRFVRAPNYVGPDRRWQREAQKVGGKRIDDGAKSVNGETLPVDHDRVLVRSTRPQPKKRKGLDRFKPQF